MLSGSENGELFLWDMKTYAHVHTFPVVPGGVWAVAFSPDGRFAASCGFDGQAILWDVNTGREVRRFKGHPGYVKWVGFSPDGRTLLTTEGPVRAGMEVTMDQGIRLWDVGTGEQLHRYGNVPEKAHCAAFPPRFRRHTGSASNLHRSVRTFALA
jgi:WD40 repeat protein